MSMKVARGVSWWVLQDARNWAYTQHVCTGSEKLEILSGFKYDRYQLSPYKFMVDGHAALNLARSLKAGVRTINIYFK